MTTQSVILVKFGNRDKYDFVGNVFVPWTDEMRAALKVREKTSYSKGIGLNAKFFVIPLEDFEDFLSRAPIEELGWNNNMPWSIDMLPEYPPADEYKNRFSSILNHGLLKLKEDAKLISFKASVFWQAEAGVHVHGRVA